VHVTPGGIWFILSFGKEGCCSVGEEGCIKRELTSEVLTVFGKITDFLRKTL